MASQTRGRTAVTGHRRGERSLQEVCHDLRQPAAAILALVSAAEALEGVDPELRRRLRQIASEARHISTLVGQAAGDALRFRPLDAAVCVTRIVESFRTSTKGEIALDARPESTIVADASALRRAVGNLLDNAVRAAGPGGAVSVTVGGDASWVDIAVADSGPGFGSGPVGIAGLGLGIVEWFAGSHGGKVSIDVSALGGPVVMLRLPAARAASRDGGR